jgi:perosamine synthetase
MVELGFNYRLPDVQCALGLSQLKKIEGWLTRRRAIAARYHHLLSASNLRLPVEPQDRRHAWHLYPVRVTGDAGAETRQALHGHLRKAGIGANVHYLPVYLHSYYQKLGYRPGLCPRAEDTYDRLLSLPMWHGMTDAQQDTVVEAIARFEAEARV